MSDLFAPFLAELAKVLEFDALKVDSQGVCNIVMNENTISLLFEFDDQLVPNTILLSSPISSIPISHRLDVYEDLLVANSQIEDTLSVKPDEDMLYLHCRLHPSIQAIDIKAHLTRFLTTANEWRTKVEEIKLKAPRLRKMPGSIQIFPDIV